MDDAGAELETTKGEAIVKTTAYEARRLEILKGVAAVFANNGFHETSVSSLAKALGVSKPVLYYYADNKDDLFHQCGQEARNELMAAMARSLDLRISALGRLRRFFTAYTEIMCGTFGRCLALVDHRALSEDMLRRNNEVRREIDLAVRNLIEDAQNEGSFRQNDPALCARALFGAFNGIPKWFDPAGKLTPADIADSYFDTFVVGLARHR